MKGDGGKYYIPIDAEFIGAGQVLFF